MLCATQAHHVYSELDKNLHTLLDRSARTSRGRRGGATSTHFLFRYVNVGIVNAWAARDYSKVLLIDIDLFPLYSSNELLSLQPPAAMACGATEGTGSDTKMTKSGPGVREAGSTPASYFWNPVRLIATGCSVTSPRRSTPNTSAVQLPAECGHSYECGHPGGVLPTSAAIPTSGYRKYTGFCHAIESTLASVTL